MDQIKTGNLIRTLRRNQHMTQQTLAGRIGVSDKAISKWERGCGAPDISLLPSLAAALGTDANCLLRGDLEENDRSNGDMKKAKFYVCPVCGNLMVSSQETELHCCGRTLSPLPVQEEDAAHTLTIQENDGDWYLTTEHEMTRGHFLSFAALVNEDTLLVKKRYPQWDFSMRLPRVPSATLYWYCTKHGLFAKKVRLG